MPFWFSMEHWTAPLMPFWFSMVTLNSTVNALLVLNGTLLNSTVNAFLVLNETLLNSTVNALLALSWQFMNYNNEVYYRKWLMWMIDRPPCSKVCICALIQVQSASLLKVFFFSKYEFHPWTVVFLFLHCLSRRAWSNNAHALDIRVGSRGSCNLPWLMALHSQP